MRDYGYFIKPNILVRIIVRIFGSYPLDARRSICYCTEHGYFVDVEHESIEGKHRHCPAGHSIFYEEIRS